MHVMPRAALLLFPSILVAGVVVAEEQEPKNAENFAPNIIELAKDCEKKLSRNCCLASVKRIKEGSYLLSKAQTLRDAKCPEGYFADTLRCKDSFIWCAPKDVPSEN